MYVLIYPKTTCICMYIYLYKFIYIFIYMYIYIYIYMFVYIYTYSYIHVSLYMHTPSLRLLIHSCCNSFSRAFLCLAHVLSLFAADDPTSSAWGAERQEASIMTSKGDLGQQVQCVLQCALQGVLTCVLQCM